MTTTRNLTFHKMAFTLLAIGAFCLGLSATAGAHPYRSGKGDRVTRMMQKFDRLDVNNDGRIGPRELRAAPARLQKLLIAANDNRDFFITRAEFRAEITKHRGWNKGHGHWKGDGTYKGKRRKDTKRTPRAPRSNGPVIRDHRNLTVTPMLPSRKLERVPARRGRNVK